MRACTSLGVGSGAIRAWSLEFGAPMVGGRDFFPRPRAPPRMGVGRDILSQGTCIISGGTQWAGAAGAGGWPEQVAGWAVIVGRGSIVGGSLSRDSR